MDNRFSDLISELCGVWWNWMKSDTIARSPGTDYKLKRTHAEKCERLIKQEYVIIDKLNLFFEGKEIE